MRILFGFLGIAVVAGSIGLNIYWWKQAAYFESQAQQSGQALRVATQAIDSVLTHFRREPFVYELEYLQHKLVRCLDSASKCDKCRLLYENAEQWTQLWFYDRDSQRFFRNLYNASAELDASSSVTRTELLSQYSSEVVTTGLQDLRAFFEECQGSVAPDLIAALHSKQCH